jgi:hypothetical protein
MYKYNRYVVIIGFELRQFGLVKGREYSRMRVKERQGKERYDKAILICIIKI